MKISVVVPCYNAVTKIHECLESLNNQTLNKDLFEVIFVDDCSNDNTYEYLKNYIADKPNFNVFKLSKNSGSPSRPRNFGTKKAKGEFIFFLDADDYLFSDTLEKYYNYSLNKNIDVVRGYLISDNGNVQKEFNRLDIGFNDLEYIEKVKILISKHTLTPPQLIRKSIIEKNQLSWNERLRMGEDTIFALQVFVSTKNIFYIDHPTYIYNQKVDPTRLSSTQTYGERELVNHLMGWSISEKTVSKIGLSFYKLRLRIALQSIIFSLLKFYTYDISRQTFTKLSKLISDNIHNLELNKFSKKFSEIIDSIRYNNYEVFLDLIKPKLLITGYDLKFIKPAIPFLNKYYTIKVDEWTGHEIHDSNKSLEYLQWADIIWCEWLLGNAVWYANNKLPNQKLVVRMHRFEMTTKYINQLNYEKVDLIFTVSLYFYEKFIEKVGISRSKVKLLPNYLILDNYEKYDSKSKLLNIGIIGILPSRKGYHKALSIIEKLVRVNPNYKLHIYGKQPNELSWIKNNRKEMEYYDNCEKFIQVNKLSEKIIFHGWTDIPKEIGKIGYVLSVSDDEEIPESFHLAPAEAFAAGNIGLFLPWRGVEYIYPQKYIFDDINQIVDFILKTDYDEFKIQQEEGADCVDLYSIEHFIKHIHKFLSY